MVDCSVSTSFSTIRSLHHHLSELATQHNTVSVHSSPRSSALPSPPDSPSSGSVSSFPSISSSFFFSSAAASPPHLQPHYDHARDSTHGLIIPSLTLPPALRRPTPYGQTLGDLRLLVLGSKGVGKTLLSGILLEDNDVIVDIGTWKDAEYGKILHASTDWVEHRDAYGLENFEPVRNVEITELPGYDSITDAQDLLKKLKSIVQTPFDVVSDVLNPNHRPSAVLAGLLSSPSTPLYTALILLLPPAAPSVLDHLIIDNLGRHIPIIVLPRISGHSHLPWSSKVSSFRPSSAVALRMGLFHSSETICLLRSEAADRFLRWREVEHTVGGIHLTQQNESSRHRGPDGLRWDKAKWESEWVSGLSHDVANRLREEIVTERDVRCLLPAHHDTNSCTPSSLGHLSFDPLHLPSLFMFSISLLEPIRAHLGRSISTCVDAVGDLRVKIALLGGFCAGVSIGMFLTSAQ